MRCVQVTQAVCVRVQEDEPSLVDNIDEVLFFAEAWNSIGAGSTGPAPHEHMLKALDLGQRGFLESILASVPQRLAMRQEQLTGAAAALTGGNH